LNSYIDLNGTLSPTAKWIEQIKSNQFEIKEQPTAHKHCRRISYEQFISKDVHNESFVHNFWLTQEPVIIESFPIFAPLAVASF
jgi:hypothetical protein